MKKMKVKKMKVKKTYTAICLFDHQPFESGSPKAKLCKEHKNRYYYDLIKKARIKKLKNNSDSKIRAESAEQSTANITNVETVEVLNDEILNKEQPNVIFNDEKTSENTDKKNHTAEKRNVKEQNRNNNYDFLTKKQNIKTIKQIFMVVSICMLIIIIVTVITDDKKTI